MKLLLLLSFISFNLFALDVDEKLTLRILRTSKSKKTVMVNRGVEDGITQGDQAKFFLTSGVIARGVVIKVSPTRSVWSLFRVVDADLVKTDSVMNLKITEPVKITADETRTIVKDDTPSLIGIGDPSKLGIPLAEGANDLSNSNVSTAEIVAIASQAVTSIKDKNYELFTGINISAMSSSSDSTSLSAAGSDTQTQFTFGFQYYFKDDKTWYSRFSFNGFIDYYSVGILGGSGDQSSTAGTEVGAGVEWHPLTKPSMVGVFIPFFTGSIASGTETYSFKKGKTNLNAQDQTFEGITFTTTVGGGFKFYTAQGYGAKMVLDVLYRRSSYNNDSFGQAFVKTQLGPRIYVALNYRF